LDCQNRGGSEGPSPSTLALFRGIRAQRKRKLNMRSLSSRQTQEENTMQPLEGMRVLDNVFVERLWRTVKKDDPRFTSNPARLANQPALFEILATAFRQWDAEEWLATFRAAGLPCGPINDIPEAFQHPQVSARDFVLTAGTVRFPGFPYKLSATPAAVRLAPPRLGEHTEQVLVEELGYSAAEVAGLRERGAV
jgi:crotonobetainyl-CoA:carnitine CoA-transferase CaiB-like acyl-CoA transferase